MKPELHKRIKKFKVYRGVSTLLFLIGIILIGINLVYDIVNGGLEEEGEMTLLKPTTLNLITSLILYIGIACNIVSSSCATSLFIDMVEETD